MIVIGAGRVGTALQARAQARGVNCHLVSRSEGWEALNGRPGAPILVATRNDDLDEVVARVPAHRLDDLVFVQNGMVRPWLQRHHLAHATRGLLFFAVPARGAPIEPGPQPSPFCGPLARDTVGWFLEIGVPARLADWAMFSAMELEKLIWNAAFGVLCEQFGCDVETVCRSHWLELRSLVVELSRVGRASLGVDLPQDWLMNRLCAYSLSIPTYRGAVKEWPWRNGWFVAEAKAWRVATPVHEALLESTGHIPVPPRE